MYSDKIFFMKNDVIVINNLSKSFGDIKAINNLSFKVKKGELFAFLGINGAGKSTTISIISGQIRKDEGEVFVDGLSIDGNMQKITSKIGIVFQSSVLDNMLTVKDNLLSRASLYGIKRADALKRIDDLANLLEFSELLKRNFGKLSGGQRRRIDIARALINKPEVLILDEPTTGLDPKTRTLLWDVIERLHKENGMTVFLTTHYMEEVSNADYVVILDSGNIVCEGTPNDLKNLYSKDYLNVYNVEKNKVEALGKKYRPLADGFQIEVDSTNEALELVVKYKDVFTDFEIVKGKMDDVFLSVTGKVLGEH